jgi:hypothetical protein
MSFSAIHTEERIKKIQQNPMDLDLKKAERDFEVGDRN